MLSVAEAANECGISLNEMYERLTEFGRVIDVRRPGKKRPTWRIPVASIEEWKRKRQKVQ